MNNMNNIYGMYWTIKDQSFSVCEHCNSVCYYDVSTDTTDCRVCQRIGGVIQKNAMTQHICSRCGWHVSVKGRAPVFGDEELVIECARCHARRVVLTREDQETHDVYPAFDCPTCGEKETVQENYTENYAKTGSRRFICHHCETEFLSIKGELIEPELCSVCKKNAVQLKYIDRFLHKQCTECKQNYTMKLELLNEDLQHVSEDNDDEDLNEVITIGVAPEHTNSVKMKQE